MKNIHWTILAALLLAAPNAVRAQDAQNPDAMAASSAPAGTAGATETGAISNSATDSTATTTTTTVTPGVDAGSAAITADTGTTQLANTGGEPLLMSLAGLSLAAGAFFLRRRVIS